MAVAAVGLLITGSSAWTAWTLDSHNEHRLLEVQTKQAGAVINSTILAIEDPLATALQIAVSTGGDITKFDRYLSADTGAGRLFVSASLWEMRGAKLQRAASIGMPAALAPGSATARSFVASAYRSPTFVVTSITADGFQRVGYAVALRKNPTFAVYAERAIPADRRVPVESDSAFSDLNFATYLGSPSRPTDLETTDVPMNQLPLRGDTATDIIAFGDVNLTLIASPRVQLGGSLGDALPWIFLVGGVLLSLATAVAARELVRRRRDAEQGARTVAGLYRKLDGLYGEQRTIAETLQRALLPRNNPDIAGLEIASRYIAGAHGVDIGGDWYSCIRVDDHRFGFVVGDVSGRGLSAATIMARLRFTARAYLLEGHGPDAVLKMCAQQLDVNNDGHFATVLAGIGDLESDEITIANAGHLRPLVTIDGKTSYLPTTVGLPLGVGVGSYTSESFVLAPGATLLAFTDGLVERRGEIIDAGLERLAEVAAAPAASLEDLLERIVGELAHGGSEDDIAVLALRRVETP
jgi:hypothetical protein